MNEDPWKHRSANMRCRTCMFFVVKMADSPVYKVTLKDGEHIPEKVSEPALGRCRERSPTIKGFPAVFEHDWCGAHKLDENKV